MSTKRDRVKRAVRKTVKWGGAGLTVLLVVVWIGSGWNRLIWMSIGGGGVALESGQFVIASPLWGGLPVDYGAWRAQPADGWYDWQFRWGPWRSGRFFAIPLWFPALLSLLATALAWRADLKHIRRARAGLCGSCGYDRAGLPEGGVCPECGSA